MLARVGITRPLGYSFLDDIPTVIPSTSVVAPETSTMAPLFHSASYLWLRRSFVASPLRLRAFYITIHIAPILLGAEVEHLEPGFELQGEKMVEMGRFGQYFHSLIEYRVDTEEYEADASTGGTAEAGIDPMTAPLVEEEIVEPAGEDSPDLPVTRDGVDRIVGIETAQGRLEADQLIASGDRARMAEAIYSLGLENLKVRAMLDIERDRVSSLRLHMSLSQEEFRQVRRDRDDARGRLRRLESYLGRRFGYRP
ncbi:hypothetical protein Tco_0552868 [Tanacetum coccineum]